MNCFQIVSLTYRSQLLREKANAPGVVNCFQIVSLTYRSQLWIWLTNRSRGCELLSDCIFDIPITTSGDKKGVFSQLWIAFRLYLWHTDHNKKEIRSICLLVVNCFQIVSLTYRSQQTLPTKWRTSRCELLSDCIFDIPITTFARSIGRGKTLWIAFRLYLWHTDHNFYNIIKNGFASCELLSDCIFDIPITTNRLLIAYWIQLWIAFRLYLWHTDHNDFGQFPSLQFVVNCFQIVSLTYRSQQVNYHLLPS